MVKPDPKLPQGLFLRLSISVSVAIYSPNSCSSPVYVPINKTNIKKVFKHNGSYAYAVHYRGLSSASLPITFCEILTTLRFCRCALQTAITNFQKLREIRPRMKDGYLKVSWNAGSHSPQNVSGSPRGARVLQLNKHKHYSVNFLASGFPHIKVYWCVQGLR